MRPLLILDLNGILCHRSREEPKGAQLRRASANIAGTAIICRSDLTRFLYRLQKHFCLAVWTSAKKTTAEQLLQILFPAEIKERLLFTWSKENCKEEVHQGDKILYQKPLDKVWREFPFWNCNNTLLIDDSPNKCPFAPFNAVHPPPIHGQWQAPLVPPRQASSPWHSDDNNLDLQRDFFEKYVLLWNEQSFTHYLSERFVSAHIQEHMSNVSLHDFLRRNGVGHMGWRG